MPTTTKTKATGRKKVTKRIKEQRTLNLPTDILEWIKKEAAADSRSVSVFIERLAAAERRRQELKTRRMGA